MTHSYLVCSRYFLMHTGYYASTHKLCSLAIRVTVHDTVCVVASSNGIDIQYIHIYMAQ